MLVRKTSREGPYLVRTDTWLGERSYGLYILHAIALVFFRWQAMPALVVTIAAAALSYRFMERPCIAYSRKENTGTSVFASS